MAGAQLKSARNIAVAALNQFDKAVLSNQVYISAILTPLLGRTDEKQRTTDLVFGTIRNRSAIDMVIAGLADCPAERIPAKLLNIIRVGAFELIYCPATAQYAIVDEAVENAKKIAGRKQAGFVNAILRQIARHIANRQTSLSLADSQKTLPQNHTSGCRFDVTILPNPIVSPADYFSRAFSLPKWLVSEWLAKFDLEKVRQICFASNRRPGIYVRPNILKAAAQQIAERFHLAEIKFEVTADQSMIKIKGPHAVTELPGFAEGFFSVQDLTASRAVSLLNPRPGQTILDLCAAPGTKTTQIAELTADKAKILATDVDSDRLKKVKENINRLGIKSIDIVAYKKLKSQAVKVGLFDAVLLDVPCSNTGVLSKRPEVRYRIKPDTIRKLAKNQLKLLRRAAELLKSGGKICYSTCSIQKEENQLLVKSFLKQNPKFKLEIELLTLPSAQDFDHDGAYAAIITRST